MRAVLRQSTWDFNRFQWKRSENEEARHVLESWKGFCSVNNSVCWIIISSIYTEAFQFLIKGTNIELHKWLYVLDPTWRWILNFSLCFVLIGNAIVIEKVNKRVKLHLKIHYWSMKYEFAQWKLIDYSSLCANLSRRDWQQHVGGNSCKYLLLQTVAVLLTKHSFYDSIFFRRQPPFST